MLSRFDLFRKALDLLDLLLVEQHPARLRQRIQSRHPRAVTFSMLSLILQPLNDPAFRQLVFLGDTSLVERYQFLNVGICLTLLL